MRVGFQRINFKGYDAVPLKNLYCHNIQIDGIGDAMREIGKKEGFGVREVYAGYLHFLQDESVIVEKDKKPYCLCRDRDSDLIYEMKNEHQLNGEYSRIVPTGGQTFIGKLPNGDKWMLASKEDLEGNVTIDELSQKYGINKENIHLIPNQMFHVDMSIRPVGYPYVLVNDPEMAEENLREIWNEKQPSSIEELDVYGYNNFLKKYPRACSCDEMCSALEEAGFVPIRIGGVYGKSVNFMNAIVNKHIDGTISYITNSSVHNYYPEYIELQHKFETDLREKIPNIDKVYFVEGKNESRSQCYTSEILQYKNGGIHCMMLEEPDFDRWI